MLIFVNNLIFTEANRNARSNESCDAVGDVQCSNDGTGTKLINETADLVESQPLNNWSLVSSGQ